MHGPWCEIRGTWCPVLDPLGLVHGALSLVRDHWCMVWCEICGSWCMVRDPRCIDPGAWSGATSLAPGAWCMVRDPWCMVPDPWCMDPGAWSGARSMVPGAWCMVHGALSLVRDPWYAVHGSWCMVWYEIRGTRCMVRDPWCLDPGAWSGARSGPIIRGTSWLPALAPRWVRMVCHGGFPQRFFKPSHGCVRGGDSRESSVEPNPGRTWPGACWSLGKIRAPRCDMVWHVGCKAEASRERSLVPIGNLGASHDAIISRV
ncbi:hypothetical protein RIF29_01795 [Crotalaria pallida]|uniref:Uncharacterized protein n=1 Tax=Crotalaria pallida TaxID=3830 RepID=A0AAN9P8L6_CROPI